MRLLRGGSLLCVLIDAQPPNLRLQRLAWYPEFCGRAGGLGDPPVAFGESRFDHFHFTQPALINGEGVGFTQNDCTFHDVLQFADIPGPRVPF